jgi:hypothetical protein
METGDNVHSGQPQSQRSACIVIALTIALLLSLVGLTSHPRAAKASYNCGNVSSGHCYARVYWTRATPGAQVYIEVVQLSCNPGWCYSNGQETGFIDNEMWFSQDNSYWVEAGYSTYTNSSGTTDDYFWADNRPGGGYHEHELQTVPGGDYGGYVSVVIAKDSGATYDVDFFSDTWNYTGYSTNNTMSSNKIWQGQELAGNEGASAPGANFIYSAWEGSNHVWNYQTTSGTEDITNSSWANGYWSAPPDGSNQGGIWVDYCCQGY